jgi:hypothetical protein
MTSSNISIAYVRHHPKAPSASVSLNSIFLRLKNIRVAKRVIRSSCESAYINKLDNG